MYAQNFYTSLTCSFSTVCQFSFSMQENHNSFPDLLHAVVQEAQPSGLLYSRVNPQVWIGCFSHIRGHKCNSCCSPWNFSCLRWCGCFCAVLLYKTIGKIESLGNLLTKFIGLIDWCQSAFNWDGAFCPLWLSSEGAKNFPLLNQQVL